MIPIVDTHQHLWDLTRFDLPWTRADRAYLPLDDYAKATLGTGIERSVYMEIDAAVEQQATEAHHVLELCRRTDTPLAGAVLPGHPGTPGFRALVARFKDDPFAKGVRQVLQVPSARPKLCLEPAFVADVRWLGANGLCFDLCMRSAELADGAALAAACPDTRFVLDHCGNVGLGPADLHQWRRDIEVVARAGNTVCKVSGLPVPEGPLAAAAAEVAPIVDHVIEAFGPRRVLFGGNWPVCTLHGGLARWIEALRLIVARRPEDEQRLLFHDNAVAFYALPRGS